MKKTEKKSDKKKKTMIIIIIIIGAAVILMGVWALCSMVFHVGPLFPFAPTVEASSPAVMSADDRKGYDQLLTLVDTEEEAQKIADDYGMELYSFADGVATFHVSGDPGEYVTKAAEDGIELNYNGEVNAMDGPASIEVITQMQEDNTGKED